MRQSYLFLALLVACSFITSCKKENSPPVSGYITSISGKFENWNSGSDKNIKFDVYPVGGYFSFGSSPIDSIGRFNIATLSAPSADLLKPIDQMLGSSTLASDHSANIFSVSELLIYSGTDSTPWGYTSYLNNSSYNLDTVGAVFGWYMYTDKDVSVSGVIANTDTYNYTLTHEYSFILKVGWNKIFSKLTLSNTNAQTYKITNIEPSNIKWYYSLIN
jgi:hypothetical protein